MPILGYTGKNGLRTFVYKVTNCKLSLGFRGAIDPQRGQLAKAYGRIRRVRFGILLGADRVRSAVRLSQSSIIDSNSFEYQSRFD